MLRALLLCLLCSPCFALDIPQEKRARNPGSFCTWTCLSVLGKVHGIKALDGIEERQKRDYPEGFPGWDMLVRGRLKSLKVKHLYQDHGETSQELLEKYADSQGVVVSLKEGNPHSKGCHSVLVTQWGDTVWFFDPNHPERLWHCERRWMNLWWTGQACVVFNGEK
jgi:hypothetical protein